MGDLCLREAASEREEVLDAVQLAERTRHEKLEVVEVLAAARVGKGDHVKGEEPPPSVERNRRHVAHQGKDGVEVDFASDLLVLKPVGRTQPVAPAFAFLLCSALPFALCLGNALHLCDDHPLHLLRRGEAMAGIPVAVHLPSLSAAFATPHIMPQQNGNDNLDYPLGGGEHKLKAGEGVGVSP